MCYGLKGVEVAHEFVAIETLVITDELFRSTDLEMRKKFEELVRSVKKGGGQTMMVSSMELVKLMMQVVRAVYFFYIKKFNNLPT